MQDEVNDKVVSLCIKGGKISAQILKNAITKALAKMEQDKRLEQQKAATQKQEKTAAAYRGKQSMRKLRAGKCELSNIEITDGNIKSFEKYAGNIMLITVCKRINQHSRPDILSSLRQRM